MELVSPMMNAAEEQKAARASARLARVRDMAERLYVAAGPTAFASMASDDEAATFAFEAAEAFERVAEARK